MNKDKLIEIVELCNELEDLGFCTFVNHSGHVDEVWVTVYENKNNWKHGKVFDMDAYYHGQYGQHKIEDIISKLKKLINDHIEKVTNQIRMEE